MNSVGFSLSANLLGLLVLIWKTVYDLWWNQRRFKTELDEAGDDFQGIAAAGKAKRDRQSATTSIAFLVLTVSYSLSIGGNLMDQSKADTYVTNQDLIAALSKTEGALSVRIKKLEDIIDPPGGTGQSYGERIERLETITEKLQQALLNVQQDQTKQTRKLMEILAELRGELRRQREAGLEIPMVMKR